MTNKIDLETGYKISPRTGKPEHAILTEGQRQYLRGDRSGYSSSTQTDYEKAIARRVYNSYLDLSLIFENLPGSRRNEIFDIGYSPDGDQGKDQLDAIEEELHDGLVDTVALLFILLEEDHHPTGIHNRTRRLNFRRVLEPGVSKAVKQIEGYEWPRIASVNVDFDVEVNKPEIGDISRMIDKIVEGKVHELSGAEARWLIHAVDNYSNLPDRGTEFREVDGWEDLGEQIRKRRDNRDDIITPDELQELSEEEIIERLSGGPSEADE